MDWKQMSGLLLGSTWLWVAGVEAVFVTTEGHVFRRRAGAFDDGNMEVW